MGGLAAKIHDNPEIAPLFMGLEIKSQLCSRGRDNESREIMQETAQQVYSELQIYRDAKAKVIERSPLRKKSKTFHGKGFDKIPDTIDEEAQDQSVSAITSTLQATAVSKPHDVIQIPDSEQIDRQKQHWDSMIQTQKNDGCVVMPQKKTTRFGSPAIRILSTQRKAYRIVGVKPVENMVALRTFGGQVPSYKSKAGDVIECHWIHDPNHVLRPIPRSIGNADAVRAAKEGHKNSFTSVGKTHVKMHITSDKTIQVETEAGEKGDFFVTTLEPAQKRKFQRFLAKNAPYPVTVFQEGNTEILAVAKNHPTMHAWQNLLDLFSYASATHVYFYNCVVEDKMEM